MIVEDAAGEYVGSFYIAARDEHRAAANARGLLAWTELLAACRAALERLKADGDPFAGPDWELGHRLSAAIGKATDPEYPD
jgi:hypothetical protein